MNMIRLRAIIPRKVVQKVALASLFLYALALPVSLAATNFFLAALCLCALFSLDEKFHCPPRSFIFLLLFFIWAVATDWIATRTFSPYDVKDFAKVWNFLPYVAIPLVFRNLSPRAESVLKTVMLTACAVAILGVLQSAFDWHYFFEGWFGAGPLITETRFVGFQSHPLHSAALYIVLLAVSVSMALFYRSGKAKWQWYLYSVILAAGLLITGSRSYYVAGIIGVFVLLAIKSWKSLAAGIAFVVIVLFSLNHFHAYVFHRLKSINPLHMSETGRQRIFMWKSALLMIRDHPVAGVGYHNWKDHLSEYRERFPEWIFIDQAPYAHAHNAYLTVAAETGFVGLALLLTFWFFVLRDEIFILLLSRKGGLSYALALGTIAAVFCLLIAAVFEHNFFTATVCLTMFFMVGLSRSQSRLEFPDMAGEKR